MFQEGVACYLNVGKSLLVCFKTSTGPELAFGVLGPTFPSY